MALTVRGTAAAAKKELQVTLVTNLQKIELVSALGYGLTIEFDRDLDVDDVTTNGSSYSSPLSDICSDGISSILDMSDDQFEDTIELLLKAREIYTEAKNQ